MVELFLPFDLHIISEKKRLDLLWPSYLTSYSKFSVHENKLSISYCPTHLLVLSFYELCLFAGMIVFTSDKIGDSMLPNTRKFFFKKTYQKAARTLIKLHLKLHVLMCHQVGGVLLFAYKIEL